VQASLRCAIVWALSTATHCELIFVRLTVGVKRRTQVGDLFLMTWGSSVWYAGSTICALSAGLAVVVYGALHEKSEEVGLGLPVQSPSMASILAWRSAGFRGGLVRE
jgi:hypothetical protein